MFSLDWSNMLQDPGFPHPISCFSWEQHMKETKHLMVSLTLPSKQRSAVLVLRPLHQAVGSRAEYDARWMAWHGMTGGKHVLDNFRKEQVPEKLMSFQAAGSKLIVEICWDLRGLSQDHVLSVVVRATASSSSVGRNWQDHWVTCETEALPR